MASVFFINHLIWSIYFLTKISLLFICETKNIIICRKCIINFIYECTICLMNSKYMQVINDIINLPYYSLIGLEKRNFHLLIFFLLKKKL